MKRLTKKQRRLAEDAIEIVPKAIHGFCKAYPGIRRKLARIDAVEVANLAVAKAAKTYDKSKSKVTTYFTMAIFNSLLKELAREQRRGCDGPGRIPLEFLDCDETVDLRSRDVRNAMSSIPDESRRLLHSRYFHGKTLEEMAGEFGIDRRTVRRRLEIAVTQLSSAWDNLAPLR